MDEHICDFPRVSLGGGNCPYCCVKKLESKLDECKQVSNAHCLEADKWKRENQRLRDQIAGFQNVDELRIAMIETAEENHRLRDKLESLIQFTRSEIGRLPPDYVRQKQQKGGQ